MSPRGVAALLGVALSSVAGAQDRERCVFPNTPNTRMTNTKLPSGQYNTFVGLGVAGRCPAKDITLRADSMESYGDNGRIFLVGNVDYKEPRLALTSLHLTYHQLTERIVASYNVVARLPSGSTLRGEYVDYYRAIPESRPSHIMANQRPTITIVQKDSAGTTNDTLLVLANVVNMFGDSLVYASGNVVMTRSDVEARGDSVMIDSDKELMVLMRGPSISGRKDRPFTLTGERIEMTTSNRKLSRVVALGKGKAVSEDMTLASDTIDLRIANDLLDRAIAWGPSRARASSATQQIVADSIDVTMPGQRVREMHAVRSAAAEGQPDTTKFKADTVDWLRGDTIVARFDTAVAKDSSRQAQIRELLARGEARSYYHMTPSDTTIRKAAINYVRGRQIVVAFKQRRASQVTVLDKASGVYVEPKPEPKPAPKPAAAAAAPKPPR